MGRLTGMMVELKASEMDIRENVELLRQAMEALSGASEIPMAQAKVPSGDSPALFSMGEDIPAVAEIEGIIISAQYRNAYWDKPMDDGRGAPVCSSTDGKSGWYLEDGEPMERSCHTCPYNRMGNAPGGKKGKACKNMARLLMLTDSSVLPVEIKVPTMSVNNLTAYVAHALVPRRLTINQVTTKLKLFKTANARGTKYYQIQFECTGRADDEQVNALLDAAQPLLLNTGEETKKDE